VDEQTATNAIDLKNALLPTIPKSNFGVGVDEDQ
jgi:hypothetical protein